jgi:hypothetical protein
MAAKKGSTVTKITTKELRLEALGYLGTDGDWAVMGLADSEDLEQLKWIKDLVATIAKGPIKYRLIERTETVRTQVSETIIEGEGKEA